MNISELRCYLVEHNNPKENIYDYYEKIKERSRYVIRGNSICLECDDGYIRFEYDDKTILKEDFLLLTYIS